jgi:hypothetical protein
MFKLRNSGSDSGDTNVPRRHSKVQLKSTNGTARWKTICAAYLGLPSPPWISIPQPTFGTIHTYDRQKQSLRLAAHLGDIDIQRAREQSVASGEGIISWVAIRRKAL